MCPTVATWRGYRISTLQRVSGTRLMYQCDGVHPWFTDNAGDTKYEFASGGTGVKISTCSENGTWVPPIEDCVGENLIILCTVYILHTIVSNKNRIIIFYSKLPLIPLLNTLKLELLTQFPASKDEEFISIEEK